jgi:crotonobetainyl-CoA:carnitine CoA-transferase CaiB-like acyl-CoA transferase
MKATGADADYAAHLLGAFGLDAARGKGPSSPHPAEAWADSGAMALTGFAEAPPLRCPAPLASCAAGAGLALDALVPGVFGDLDAAALLGERAALTGFSRNGPVSPGGACRLLSARDGTLALTLARDEDWALLPAWLEAEIPREWDALGASLASRGVDELVSRARLLGLAAAAEAPPQVGAWLKRQEGSRRKPPARAPLVVDLSALWAGPLASQLLARGGARVIKVESLARPDGARRGPADFFDLMNAGKESVALDFAEETHRLRALLTRADIVIEASRPRALHQLGVAPEALVAAHPGLVWISITGYGRDEPGAGWIAYGDDAGIAAGLSHILRKAHGCSVFCADAVADPLTGLHAALAALAAFRTGRGGLYSLALRDVTAHCALFDPPAEGGAKREGAATAPLRAAPPRARPVRGPAAALGADTPRIMKEFSC